MTCISRRMDISSSLTYLQQNWPSYNYFHRKLARGPLPHAGVWVLPLTNAVPVAVIIPTYNRALAVLSVLEKIQACDPKPVEIWVHVDSADGTLESFLHEFPRYQRAGIADTIGWRWRAPSMLAETKYCRNIASRSRGTNICCSEMSANVETLNRLLNLPSKVREWRP